MLHKLLLVLIVLSCMALQAQTIRSGEVYGGEGYQHALRTVIDNTGARYTLVEFFPYTSFSTTYNASFTVDSLGTPITISQNSLAGCHQRGLALIRYNSAGVYQWHAMLRSFYSDAICTDRYDGLQGTGYVLGGAEVDGLNQLEFCINIYGADSVELIGADKGLFKQIISPAQTDSTLVLLCKLNSNGQFMWANALTKNKPNPANARATDFARFGKSLAVNANGQNLLMLEVFDLYQPYVDTLTLTYTNGSSVPIYVNHKDVALTFDANGLLLQQASPFGLKGRQSADSLEVHRSVTDGTFTYHLITVNLGMADTLLAPSPLPLLAGYNVVLVKTDAAQQVVWAKWLGRGAVNVNLRVPFNLLFNPVNQQLVLGFTAYHYVGFVFAPDLQVTPVGFTTIIVAKLNTAGVVLWRASYGDYADWLFELAINPLTNGLVLLGYNQEAGINFGTYNLPDPGSLWFYFVAFFDTDNQCTGATFIKGNRRNALDFLYGAYSNDKYAKINNGNGFVNKQGQVYITGVCSDTFYLACNKKLITTNLASGRDFKDGFVLVVDPPATIKDTGVCNSMVSPSGKYTWSSNGLYRDTALNSLGCDSVLLFKLTILNNQSVVDTNVCYQLVSPSGKYTYTTNGTYEDTIPNHKGCDSIITIKVQVLHRRDTLTINQCKPYLSPSGKYTYKISGQYLDTLKTTTGCDSILLINFTRSFLGDTLTINKCKPYTSPSGKYTYNVSGQYIDTLTTTAGCDSVLLITFNRTFLGDTINVNRCKQYTSPSGKYTYNTSGQYWDTLQTNAGCDSVLLINFTTQQNGSTLTINTCNPYLTPSGKDTLTQSGTYTDTLTNQFNCDSIITIILTQQTFTVQATAGNEVSCDTPFTPLQATAAVSYRWSPPDYLSDTTISNPIASPTQSITYVVTATNDIGCSSTDSVNVVVKRVEKAYTLPNVFTPNGDGYNDCFPLVNESKLSSVSFTIYNRWGNEVYSTTNPNACWLGTDNHNNPVPVGAYYYVLTGQNNCGTPITTNGSIQVLR